MKKTKKEASELGHRAKRAKELELRDCVLSVCEKGLQDVSRALAMAAVATACRPEIAARKIAEAQRAIDIARRLMLAYYDDPAYD